MSSRADPTRERIPTWLLGILFGALPFAVYWPLLGAGFVLDDEAQVTMNAAVREFSLTAIFGNGYWSNVTEGPRAIEAANDLYRPLTTLSLAASYQLFGTAPLGYHVENLLWHGLASFLVIGLLRAWRGTRIQAIFGALLFAVAPIHIEPIASIVLRNELLCAIFAILCLRSVAAGRPALAGLTLLAALMTKESAVAVPVVAALADHVVLRIRGAQWRQRVPTYLWMLGAIALYLAIRAAVLGRIGLGSADATYFGNASPQVVWLTMAKFAAEHYLSGAILGTPLVYDFSPPSIPLSRFDDTQAWVCLAGWVAVAVASFYAALRYPAQWAFGPLVFFMLIGPTANIATRIGVVGATRLMYLPYLGIAITILGLFALLARRSRGDLAAVIATALLLGYAAQSTRRSLPFRSDYQLQLDILAHVPANSAAMINAGHRATDFALGNRQPPSEFARRTRDEWLREAFDRYATGIRLHPLNILTIRRALIFAAFETGSEVELVELLDLGTRMYYKNLRLPPLPVTGWHERAPLAANDRMRLHGWARALQVLNSRSLEDQLVGELAALLPDYFRLRALQLAGASNSGRLVRARTLRDRLRSRATALHPMMQAVFGQKMMERATAWTASIEGAGKRP